MRALANETLPTLDELNLGLLLRVIGEPIQAERPNPISGWILVVAAAMQFCAGLAFAINTWSRVREK